MDGIYSRRQLRDYKYDAVRSRTFTYVTFLSHLMTDISLLLEPRHQVIKSDLHTLAFHIRKL